MPSLEWNAEVERDTAHLYERIKNVVPSVEWPFFAPYVRAINALKKERNAVILAHNYQTPEIYHCVADFVGDTLQLAREATQGRRRRDRAVRRALHGRDRQDPQPRQDRADPRPEAGCSLASSITGADVRLLRERFPGVPVVTYVNTSAEVKAESDITCTSSNALQVVESLGVDKVIFLPDQYLAKYVAAQTKVKIIAWKGSCEVHERFTGDELALIRANDPSVQIVAHPECPPDVIAAADFTGSTADMIDWVRKNGRSASCWSPNARWPTTCRPNAGRRVRAAVQSLPAHEADHAAEDSRQPAPHEGGGRGRSRRSPRRRAARSSA